MIFGKPYSRIVRTAGGLFIALAALAQENPFRNNKGAIQEGHALYDRTCTICHGMNGTVGARGPALAGGRNYYRTTDQALYDTIHDGLPGTGMPSIGLAETDIWKVVSYIRSLRATASDAFVPGDAAHGEQIFWGKGNCGSCHMINGRGGILGPDLSNVGGERTIERIRAALTRPERQPADGYRPVDVVTSGGVRVSGVLKNENNFSLQILDTQEKLRLFTRDELREVQYRSVSFMPANYDKALGSPGFEDLLAFLSRQARNGVRGGRRGESRQ
jgi:cytochrome c oxidase cbb3-type subunit 3